MPDRIDVSIIICTCNRAGSLLETLAAIRSVEVPPRLAVELLVVDNGSTDETDQVVRAAQLPNIVVRYLREPTRGKGYAYNTGLHAANGDVLLFTDDDVRPPANWIDGMCRPILRGEADATAGGVRIAAHLRRPWMTRVIREWLACTDDMDPARVDRLIGANMAFARRVLESVPAFDAELGPGAIGFFDETLFSAQLLKAGYRIVAVYDVAVEHHFDADRLEGDGLVKVAQRLGRSHAYMFYHWEHRRLKLPTLHLVRENLRMAWRYVRHGGPWSTDGGSAPEWKLDSQKRIAFVRQYLLESRRARQYSKFGLVKLSA